MSRRLSQGGDGTAVLTGVVGGVVGTVTVLHRPRRRPRHPRVAASRAAVPAATARPPLLDTTLTVNVNINNTDRPSVEAGVKAMITEYVQLCHHWVKFTTIICIYFINTPTFTSHSCADSWICWFNLKHRGT